MKKRSLICLLLAFSMLFASACGQKTGGPNAETEGTVEKKDYSDEVDADKFPYEAQAHAITVKNHLTDYPNYSLPADATEEDCRAMIVNAMNDELTFPWAPIQSFQYKISTGASRDLNFDFTSLYGGIPYNNRGKSLMHVLQWYDFETGYMYAEDFSSGNPVYGNTCASSVTWAQAAVCPSLTAIYTADVNPAHGYTVLGDLKGMESPSDTSWVLAQNSDEDIFRAYSLVKPGDSLLTHDSPKCGDHNMMVTGVDTVYKEDGSIDPEASMIHIQDQWGSLYDDVADGEKIQYCGRRKDFSFRYFRDNDYVPYCLTELFDYKGHEVLTYSVSKENPTFKECRGAKVTCNYRLCTATCRIISESGTCVLKKTTIFDKFSGTYALSAAFPMTGDIEDAMVAGRTYTLELTARAANGELLRLYEIPLTLEDLKR